MANDERLIDFAIKALEQISTMQVNSLKIGEEFVKTVSDFLTNSRIGKEFRGKPLMAYYAPNDRDFDTMKLMLKNQEIPFLTMQTRSGEDAILIREEDKDRLSEINQSILDSRRPGQVSKDAVMIRGNGEINSYSELSSEQAYLFVKKAEERGVSVCARESGPGKFSLFFADKDSQQVLKIAASVAYDLSGKTGQVIKDQINYQEKNARRIGLDMLNPNIKKDIYIVGRNGDVAIKRDAFFYYNSGKTKYRLPIHGNENKVTDIVALMDRPVDMDTASFNKYMALQTKDRQEYLDELDNQHGAPVISEEMKLQLKGKESQRHLIEEKLLQANPAQTYIRESVQNQAQDVDRYIQSAKAEWEHQHDMAQMGVDDPVLLDDARAMQNGFVFTEDPYIGDTSFYDNGPFMEYTDEDIEFFAGIEEMMQRDLADEAAFMDLHDQDGDFIYD